MRVLFPIVLLSLAVPAFAQVQSRPSDAPIVTADREDWYVKGEPIQFAGNTYYRAGAAIFFDGNRMVRTGNFNGVPLYADTTIEPFSIVLVPIGRGLMQPYERPRTGELAGTVGSRTPTFPVSVLPDREVLPAAAAPPTNLPPPAPIADVPATAGAATVPLTAAALAELAPAPARGGPASVPLRARPAEDAGPAREHVWIDYRGQKWVNAGAAIAMEGSGLVRSGEYAGFPVFTRGDGQDDRIYLPALPGLVTPYQRKQ